MGVHGRVEARVSGPYCQNGPAWSPPPRLFVISDPICAKAGERLTASSQRAGASRPVRIAPDFRKRHNTTGRRSTAATRTRNTSGNAAGPPLLIPASPTARAPRCQKASVRVKFPVDFEWRVVSRERSERFGPATPAGPKRSLRSRLTTYRSSASKPPTENAAGSHARQKHAVAVVTNSSAHTSVSASRAWRRNRWLPSNIAAASRPARGVNTRAVSP